MSEIISNTSKWDPDWQPIKVTRISKEESIVLEECIGKNEGEEYVYNTPGYRPTRIIKIYNDLLPFAESHS